MGLKGDFLKKGSSSDFGSGEVEEPWFILISDDDEEVHTVTRLSLDDLKFDGRPVEFLSAYSGRETREILESRSDIALILLDVVMESDTAGLDVVQFLRDELCNQMTRIVLRTGQPGQAPEREVIQKYDINDYKEKIELTDQKLFSAVYSSLRAYRDIRRIQDSLSEKEVLLREVHHRVNSNLQILSSLFRFQDEEISDPVSRKVFRQNCGRIRTMALIHEQLYHSENLNQVDLHETLRDYVLKILGAQRRSIPLEISWKTQELRASVTSAVPFGLFVHEVAEHLVSGSDSHDGEFLVELFSADSNGVLKLEVSGFQVSSPGDDAFQLWEVLASQLGGEFSFDSSDAGGAVSLIFNPGL